MKLIIAGTRTFNDYRLLKEKLDHFLKNTPAPVEIVSGTCAGADLLGEKYAAENNLPVTKFPADWNKYGKKAGYIRNVQMAEYATHAVVFWDGKSKGTEIMIREAKKREIPVRIVML